MEFEIAGKKIGDGHPVFFIAEAGVNHNGSVEMAKELIREAHAAGADCVKFQTFKTEKLSTRQAPKSSYHIETTGDDAKQSWFDLLKSQQLDKETHQELIGYAKEIGIIFLSTPYDEESAELLFELGVPAFKIASTDTNNFPFLRYLAGKRLPIILSTAMSTLDEVTHAVRDIRGAGLKEIALLQCTGNYPARLEDSNLLVMRQYKEEFDCIVGYSDHTEGLVNPIAATALGAAIYEKHFTLDKSLPGPDHRMSLNPMELAETIHAIRQTESALGSGKKSVLESERENRVKLRKSLVASISITRGTIITPEMVSIKRPGSGMPPEKLPEVIGKMVSRDVEEDTLLTESMFE